MIRGTLKLKDVGGKDCGTCVNSKRVTVPEMVKSIQWRCYDSEGWIWVSLGHVCDMHSFPGGQRRTRMVRAL